MHAYLKGRKCRAYYAPPDVRLFEEKGNAPKDVDTVVQPDLIVLRGQSKADRCGVHGAPDLAIELLFYPSRWSRNASHASGFRT